MQKTKSIALILGVITMSFLVGYLILAAWTEPTTSPPGGNVPPPLNTSINAQAKEGALVVGANPSVGITSLIVLNGNVGIGTTNPGEKLEVVGNIISKGTSWTTRSAAGNDDGWFGVTYGNGLFVAVGALLDRVMTSPDGINWTARSAAGDNDNWYAVTYGNGLFVAVAISTSEDVVMTSPDGINWTARSAAGDNDYWYDVTYGNGLFVAVASNGGDRVMTSPDGINWTARSAAGNDDGWNAVTYGNGLFVAVSYSGDRVMTSGKTEISALAHNNIYQGGMSIMGGNVGIGTTTPSQKLDVAGYVKGQTGLCIGNDCRTSWPTGGGGGVSGTGTTNYIPKWTASTTLANSQIYDTGTNVGIGTTEPVANLNVNGSVYFEGGSGDVNGDGVVDIVDAMFIEQYLEGLRNFTKQQIATGDVNGDAHLDSGDAYIIGGMVVGIPKNVLVRDANDIYTVGCIGWGGGGCTNKVFLVNGNVGIGTTGPSYKLDVVSGGATTARFGTVSTDKVVVGGGAGKIDVGTVDPIFKIDGKKYATYMADFAGGTRVETSGVVKLENQNSKPKTVIDLENLEEGSDLWLFWQASNKDIEDLVVILTPGFEGKVWYEKSGNTVTIYGDQAGEVSYRLTLPRVDEQKWGNLAEDQSLEGIKVLK